MSNQKGDQIRIVRGEDRFAGSSNVDLALSLDLNVDEKNNVEGSKNVIVNLQERFNQERFNSGKYRVGGKITNIFDNSISAKTEYEPFRNNMFYLDALGSVTNGSEWKGYPQYDEFSFFRTRGIPGHVQFEPISATSYNWMVYLSYVSRKDSEQSMTVRFEVDGETLIRTFSIGDGVPYYNKSIKVNGKVLTYFYCAFKHNLRVGDFVRLKTPVNGKTDFEVYGLGDLSYGNDEKVFYIYNIGYTGGLFDGETGVFKRIGNIKNVDETICEYYVRIHKTITENVDKEVYKMGFENNIFPVKKKLEYASLTPNGNERVSVKDGTQTVGFSFQKDVDVSSLRNHLGRPVTELYVTIINKGYMGYFNKPSFGSGLQVGWDFNLLTTQVDNWWNLSNNKNVSGIPNTFYEKSGIKFYYNSDLPLGYEVKGDICEYNKFEQQEVVLSKHLHKYSFNYNVINNNSPNSVPDGYVYYPHYEVRIKALSDYVEVGDRDKADLVPDYAFYSEYERQWRWRDIYVGGFIDTNGVGLNIPFINGAHYPFKSIVFLQRPLKISSAVFNDIIYSPISDDCE